MINRAIILGNLGNKPELKYSSNGSAICSLSVATSESWKDKNTGESKTTTEWHKVSVFGKLAEIAGQYLDKGSKVYIEGKIQTRKWQDKEGNDRYTTEIVVSGFGGVLKMLDGKSDSNNEPNGVQKTNNTPQAPIEPVPVGDEFGDEIPFAPVHHSLMI